MKAKYFLVMILFFFCFLVSCNKGTSTIATDNEIESTVNFLLFRKISTDLPQKIEQWRYPGYIEYFRNSEKKAFPYLISHLGDERKSSTTCERSVTGMTIEQACLVILQDIIHIIPEDYPPSLYREGADGKLHPRPYICSVENSIFTSESAEDWFKQRENKTLKELQIEALEWVIEGERKIGFRDNAKKELILSPLLRQLKRMKK